VLCISCDALAGRATPDKDPNSIDTASLATLDSEQTSDFGTIPEQTVYQDSFDIEGGTLSGAVISRSLITVSRVYAKRKVICFDPHCVCSFFCSRFVFDLQAPCKRPPKQTTTNSSCRYLSSPRSKMKMWCRTSPSCSILAAHYPYLHGSHVDVPAFISVSSRCRA
jgi:hypothetical protein